MRDISEVSIWQRSKTKVFRSPISGYEWREETLIEKYDIHTPSGVMETCNTYEKAEIVYKKWEDYLHNFPFLVNE